MNVGEASRQYQCALEAERHARSELAGVVSAEDELTAVTDERLAAYGQLVDAFVEAECTVLERPWA